MEDHEDEDEEDEVEAGDEWWSSESQRSRMEDMLIEWEAQQYEAETIQPEKDDIPDVFYKKDRVTKHQKTRGMMRRRKK